MDQDEAVWIAGVVVGGLSLDGLVLTIAALGLLLFFLVVDLSLRYMARVYLERREMELVRLFGSWIVVGISLIAVYSLLASYGPSAIAYKIVLTYFIAAVLYVLWKVPDLERWIFAVFFR